MSINKTTILEHNKRLSALVEIINTLPNQATPTITFTIDGTEYQAEEGMTWTEWVESEYNTRFEMEQTGYIYDSYSYRIVANVNGDAVSYDALIENNNEYLLIGSGGSNI